jgi:two-component system, chemotaxis family, protein-glutamate methylesterase/glutaminase
LEKLGAIRYFTKPFDLAQLISTIMDILDLREKTHNKPGFSGSFGHLNMIDIFQIHTLIKQTGLLTVNCGTRTGKIYLHEGEIIHAECSNMSGEDCVFEILSWGQGEFDFKEHVLPLKQTLKKSYEHLLIEYFRRKEIRKESSESDN